MPDSSHGNQDTPHRKLQQSIAGLSLSVRQQKQTLCWQNARRSLVRVLAGPVWNLHVLPVFVWVSSGCTNFLHSPDTCSIHSAPPSRWAVSSGTTWRNGLRHLYIQGGWAVIMCPCGIVYSIKCNLQAESPRDFADMLLSWKHLPNVVIYDFARGLSTHTNLRQPITFTPFEGRLLEPTTENIAKAKSEKLQGTLPWLTAKKQSPDPDDHPITGFAEHYVLYDRFHEDNTKDPHDSLRKLRLVPQLAGKVNSPAAEQLFSKLKKNNYFMNMALPSTHVFLLRNIIHHYNVRKNEKRLHDINKEFNKNIHMNDPSQVVLGPLTALPENIVAAQMTAASPGISSVTSPQSSVPITEKSACEPTKPWERDWHPLQEKLLDYVLERNRPGSEIFVKEGQVCLIREEFWSLGLLRDMDSHIGNACMKLICEMARQIGKDIYIKDFFVLPVWKTTPNNIVTGLPEDADLKDLLAFPAWTNANGPDHFVVCVRKY
ncbi:uncharacterized protein isoform X1 [Danio rerio]|uniref:Uncharacterized protein isoform X1 n=1 Tax=Danio rerio TaxID=7955 RepID=A0AC58I629_DANRE